MLRHAIRPTRLPGNVLRGLSSPLTRWVCSCQPNDEDHVIGFSRPREGEPVGSLKLLHQVVFVHTGHDDWPLAWAQGEPTAIRDFVDQANQEKKNVGHGMGLAGCDLPARDEDHVTVTSFPHAKQFHLRKDQLENDTHALFSHFQDNQMAWSGLSDDLTRQHFVYICCHGSTDQRCGYCGPRLVDAFEKYLQTHALSNRIHIVKTTHTGGHKFAGNAVTFPSGDWFGYVTPDRVGEVISAAVEHYEKTGEGRIIPDLWRGRMGLSKQEAIARCEEMVSTK